MFSKHSKSGLARIIFYSMSINQLKQKIFCGPKRIKQGQLLWMCLDFVKKHPEHFIDIGVQWIDYSNFIFNCKIFSNFVGRKTNTLNNYFKHHGFQCRRINNNLKLYIDNLFSKQNYPLSDGWIIRYLDGFTQSTTESESKKLKFIPSENIKRQKLRMTLKLANDNNENSLKHTDNKNDFSNLHEQSESSNKKDLYVQNKALFNQESQNIEFLECNVENCEKSKYSISQSKNTKISKICSKSEKNKCVFDLSKVVCDENDDFNENNDDEDDRNDDTCNYY